MLRHHRRIFPSGLALLLGAGLALSACGDLVPGLPIIPDLNTVYKQAQNRADGKLAPPVLSGMTIVNPYPGPNVPVPQLSVLPAWPEGVTPPEPVSRYLLRQRGESAKTREFLTSSQDTAVLFPGLSGRFDMLLPEDIAPDSGGEPAARRAPPSFAELELGGELTPPAAWRNPIQSITDAPSLSPPPARSNLVAMPQPESDSVEVDYQVLQEAAARAQGTESDAVQIDFGQLDARRSCPLLQTRNELDDIYDGFNAETVRFAWENEPIAAILPDSAPEPEKARASTESEISAPQDQEMMDNMEKMGRLDMPENVMQRATAPRAAAPRAAAPRATAPRATAPQGINVPRTTVPRATAPSATPPLVSVPASAAPPARTAPADEKRYHAYFDFASARLSPKVLALTKSLAQTYAAQGGHIQLIGHAHAGAPKAAAGALERPEHYVGGGNLSLARSQALSERLVALGVKAEDIQLVESDRRPPAYDALPNIEIMWRAAALAP